MRPPIHLTFEAVVALLARTFEQLPDARHPDRVHYPLRDCMLAAFAMFFFQHPSMLHFQRRLQQREGRCNLETIFGVRQVPSDTQLRAILDGAPYEPLRRLLATLAERYRRSAWLTEFRTSERLGGRFYPVAFDGTDYFSSTQISCGDCLRRQEADGQVRYRHAVLAATLFQPRTHHILPLDAEPIRNSDGLAKQDCEINAAKRLLARLRREHPKLPMLLVGDAIFAHEPLIAQLQQQRLSFVFTVKEGSQPETYAWVADLEQLGGWVEGGSWQEGPAAKRRDFTYRIVRQVPLAQTRRVWVNFFEVWERDAAGQAVYHSAWVTDLAVRADNVAELCWVGRGKWKIENEHFNTHKNGGYELEHNYGHGQRTLATVLYFLNLLAFVAHQVLERSDRWYRRLRAGETRRELWNGLRFCVHRFVVGSWRELLQVYDPRVVEDSS